MNMQPGAGCTSTVLSFSSLSLKFQEINLEFEIKFPCILFQLNYKINIELNVDGQLLQYEQLSIQHTPFLARH